MIAKELISNAFLTLFCPIEMALKATVYSYYLLDKNYANYKIEKYKQDQAKVSKTAIQTLKKFIGNIESNNNLIFRTSPFDCFESSYFPAQKLGVINLPKRTLEEAEKGEICHSCKFLILHEFGHIVNKDCEFGLVALSNIAALFTWVVSFKYNPYVLSCVIAKITRCTIDIFYKYSTQWKEVRADDFAAEKGGKKVSLGGYVRMYKEIKMLLNHRSNLIHCLFISSRGNLLDFAHPLLSDRMKRILDRYGFDLMKVKEEEHKTVSCNQENGKARVESLCQFISYN